MKQNLIQFSFHVGNPEGIHQLMVLFSDRGTPKSVRHMNSYSGHTYKFTKAVSDGLQALKPLLTGVILRMARSNMRKFTLKRDKAYRILAVKRPPELLERTLTI